MEFSLDAYLQASEVIDWYHPTVIKCAAEITAMCKTPRAIAQVCFEWVRDNIYHSVDYRMNPVTCRASEVLAAKTGYCYAKSHLLAALLRANQIPAGFCYQRLSIDNQGAPYCLHGFNAIHLPEMGWYRVDARGNNANVNVQFSPPQASLAFKLQFPEETEFPAILAEPLPFVVDALRSQPTWEAMLQHLPDITLESAPAYGLMASTGELRTIHHSN